LKLSSPAVGVPINNTLIQLGQGPGHSSRPARCILRSTL
jgi:hypothetical protein